MIKRFSLLTALGALFLVLVTVSSAYAVDTLGVYNRETIPLGRNPYDIIAGKDGNYWLTQEDNLAGSKVVRFNPNDTNPATRFKSWTIGPSASITMLANGPDNSIWYAYGEQVGKIDIDSEQNTLYAVPQVLVGSTMQSLRMNGLSTGPDGRVWAIGSYADATGAEIARVFRLNANGTVYASYAVTGGTAMELVSDPVHNVIWYSTRYQTTSRVGKIDMNGTASSWQLPSGMSYQLMSITMGPDDKLWYSGNSDKFGNIDINGTMSSLYQLPNASSNPGIWKIAQGHDGYLWATLAAEQKLVRIDSSGNMQNTYYTAGLTGGGSFGAYPIGLTRGFDGNMWFVEFGSNSVSKVGTGTANTSADSDSDGLTVLQEAQQGTSDNVVDTDQDGLNDYIESSSYPSRSAVFCGSQCAYPHPTQKDIFVEVDWMEDGGGYSMKPTTTQLDKVVQAFKNKGINLVFDTGQYGGGNQVVHYSPIWFGAANGEYDMTDYKEGGDGISSNFSSARTDIWHYMISGDHYRYIDENNNVVTNSTGMANVSGQNSFVAYKRVDDLTLPIIGDFDTALGGTIIHELGHNLCLTSAGTVPLTCQFAGIDNEDPQGDYEDYASSMYYDHQFTMVDYSMGVNGLPGDHDDWGAIRPQDFNTQAPQLFGQKKQSPSAKNNLNKKSKSFRNAASASERTFAPSIIRR